MDIREDVVYEVLQSMTEKEEKFFVKSARKNTFYFTLYTLITKRKVYDQKQLTKELEKLGCKQPLYKLKAYLKTEILQSLILYNKEDIEMHVMHQLSECKMLILKGLYAESSKILQTVKSYVIDKGLFHIMPTIYEMDYKLSLVLMELKPEVFNEYQQCFEDNLVNYRLDYIYYFLKEINLKVYTIKGNQELRDKVENILEDPYMIEKESNESIKIKTKRYHIKSLYYIMIDDIDESLMYANKASNILNKNPAVEFYATMKISLLRNIITSFNNFKRIDLLKQESKSIISDLTEISTSNYEALGLLMQIKNLQMIFTNNYSDLDYNTEVFLKKHRLLNVDFRSMILLSFALVFMKKGDYETALDWLDKVFRFCKKHEQPYKLLGARVLSYWVHFKLGNYRMLESLQLSIKRQMANTNISSIPYDYMIKYSRQYISAYDIPEQIEVLENWKNKFDELPFTVKMHFNAVSFSFSDNLKEMIQSLKASQVQVK